jgi:hypothetical protein
MTVVYSYSVWVVLTNTQLRMVVSEKSVIGIICSCYSVRHASDSTCKAEYIPECRNDGGDNPSDVMTFLDSI